MLQAFEIPQSSLTVAHASLAMESNFCADADKSFGPNVPSECRGGFDFTILFENIFFAFLPATALLVASAVRLWGLRCVDTVAFKPLLQIIKQCVAIADSIIRLVTLVLWALPSSFRTKWSLPSATLSLLASLSVCILSYSEGRKSIRPSIVLNVYLFFASLFDIVQLRTLWLASSYAGLQRIATSDSVGLALRILLLILEAIPKQEREVHVSPEDTAGLYSLRTFWWLNRILLLGRTKQLESSDLFPIDSGLRTSRYSPPLRTTWKTVDRNQKYALLGAVVTTLKWPVLAPVVPRLVLIGFTYAQPLLIKRALNYVAKGESEEKNIGYGLIGATVLVYCGLAIFNGYYNHLLYRSITLIRGSLIDIVYHKSLEIELTAAQEAAPAGKSLFPSDSKNVIIVLRLVTADIDQLTPTIEKIHSLWASIIELGIGTYLLQIEVGWACTGPIIVTLFCTVATSYVSKLLPARQKTWNQAVQKRVGLTSTMLSNMKTVKMMGLSSYIATTLQAARITELDASGAFRRCMSVVNVLVLIPKQLSAPVTLTLYVLAVEHGSGAGKLSASRAFTVLTIVELITGPLSLALMSITSITRSLACLDRVQTYLKSPDKADGQPQTPMSHEICNVYKLPDSDASITEKTRSLDYNIMISIKDAAFGYKGAESPALESISFDVLRHSITAIAGSVGSGKSTLLKSILGELELRAGEKSVLSARIAYCDQTPWVQNGTLRSCIIGTSKFDSSWFDEVVNVCALEEDFSVLADGHDTMVGSRGIAFSDGQRQRLALARALYSRAPLLILDDVFRSLDARTAMKISERLLSPNGLIRRCNLTAVIITQHARHLAIADQVIVLEKGTISQLGSFQNLKSRGGYIQDSAAQEDYSDHHQEVQSSGSKTSAIRKPGPKSKLPNTAGTSVIGSREKSVYSLYLRHVGALRVIVLLIAVMALALATRLQRILVQWWTEADGRRQSTYIGLYFFLAIGACLSFTFFFWWMWMSVVPATAGGLHEQLLSSIMNAPLSYFTTVDSGIILNRFSQDMAVINGMLPVNIFQAISIFMICLVQLAFIAYGSNYLAIAVPVTLIVLWILVRYYLLTSQQLRVIELELKAPIYTSLTETKEGLATIRAFGWQSAFEMAFQTRIDESKKAIYMLFMIQRWLNFVLDLVVAGLATTLVTLATQLRDQTDAATLGVGLSSVIGFSLNMSQLIVCYTELENSLGAISRIKDCVDNVEAEDSSGNSKEPPDGWLGSGAIEFKNVTASYKFVKPLAESRANANQTISDNDSPALNEISFNVLPGQKICICGRTGSGKSTLVSTLLRLLEVSEGMIVVDGVDISTLRPEAVRKSINVIPQTPYFLPGSVHLNLPSLAQDEDAVITALQKVGLWDLISARGGLEADISKIGLSHGQQQLFCLAAAMLKKSKIVLIDEATSGVDSETERRMDDLIREEFRGCVVISISHRLAAVMDFDQVVVLHQGRCVEIGEPKVLLEKRGEFWKLLHP
ncbi:uncharacterized protein L3040_006301 [Drepanopeziza brunnea f. sp. 'multigermtubi']|uniref:uncharacterized protein n=1 Tax=Drepanopeziza brunnea f. sp. 'multigermtubi' TaxID=698441 RepID=UPI00239234BC|nr:hypothetical protein L3040_006301 [Drepanopeziza brunnea f. sp. 'multigermtubi']